MFVICIYIYTVDFMNNGNEFSCSKNLLVIEKTCDLFFSIDVFVVN